MEEGRGTSKRGRRQQTRKAKKKHFISLTTGTRNRPRPRQPQRQRQRPSAIASRGELQEQQLEASFVERREKVDAKWTNDDDVQGDLKADVEEKRLSCGLEQEVFLFL